MTQTLNFLDTTGLFADVDRLPGKLVPTLLRRIRVFDTKNLIPVHREETGRREGRLDLVGACMARVHSELIDFGLDAETLRRLREFFDRPAELGIPDSAFALAVEKIQVGLPVMLTVELWQRTDPWHKGHHFILTGHIEKSHRVKTAAAMAEADQGTRIRASLRVDLKDLLSDFVQAFEAATAEE